MEGRWRGRDEVEARPAMHALGAAPRAVATTEAEVTGDALLVAGYEPVAAGAEDPRLPLFTQLGEALLASPMSWRIRRLAAHGGERDVPSRANVRREIDAMLQRPAAARLLVMSAGVIRTVEGLALACAPELGGFREDTSVSLEWLAMRLRHAAGVPTAVVLAAPGRPGASGDAASYLDVLGTAAPEHLIVVDTGEPAIALRGVIDGLWSDAIDLATGSVTPRSLGSHLARRLHGAAIQPSESLRVLHAARGLARADLGERAAEQRDGELDELIGAVLPGRFRVLAEIGRGSFGVVYRAHHDLLDQDVAIKVLPARLGGDAIRRFALEVRTMSRLHHGNTVRVLHADVMRDGRMFVAMELLAGPTLEQRIAAGAMPPAAVLVLVRQLVAGLAAAHAAGVIHGDVKPANMVVVDGEAPRLVLLDFGLARLRADDAASLAGGTPAFMAPEQLRGAPGDASTDLYAAARVGLAMVSGAPPRTADEQARALAMFTDDRVRGALGRALARDPADRFPSAIELAAALGAAPGEVAAPPRRPPFRLAAPFAEEDHEDFHGRKGEIERLLEHVLFRRAVVYVAPSGTGKTSLLRAGLVPRLRALDVDVAYIACRAGVAGDVAAAISPGASSVIEAIARRLETSSPRRLVVVIDQIEAALVDGRDEQRGAAVLEALDLARWPLDAPIGVVWSVREEYLARLLDRVQRLEPGVPIVRLGPLAPEVAADIFTRTLASRGMTADPALVDALVRDLTGAAAGLAVELGWGAAPAVYPPHLQLAGAVLHDASGGGAIDLALYQRVGGLAAILAEHLHHVLEGELGASDTAIARDVLLALVTTSHTRIACEQSELVARVSRGHEDRTAVAVIAVLEFLRDRGLLVAAAGTGRDPVWDLAHDSLVAQVEAWMTATDLARRRALELVRYHLRRSSAAAPSRLSVAELREVRDHLAPSDLTELDDEWQTRWAVPDPASRLIASSRRAVASRRLALAAFVVAAVAIAGGFAWRWLDSRHEIVLRDRDIGDTQLALRAFDWDPARQAAVDVTTADFSWQLVRPAPEDPDLPGPPFDPEDLSSHELTPSDGAVRRVMIAARGGPAVLVIARRDRRGASCSPVTIPIRRMPGHGETRSLTLRLPTCEATLAGMRLVPEGRFIAGGPGEPPSPRQLEYKLEEQVVWLPSYWLDVTEVSNAALAAVRDAFALGDRAPPIYPDPTEFQRAAAPDRPVASLTWTDAAVVCRLLGKRLPTTHEWQKALRGGESVGDPPSPNPYPRRNLPWGPEVDAARTNINRGETIAPAEVGSFPGDLGPYGHLDLAGNVSEWTAKRRADGLAIMRGGNWAETTPDKLVDLGAIENPRQPQYSDYAVGFRCAVQVGAGR